MELIELTGAQIYDNDNQVDMLIVLCDTNEKNLTKIKEKYLKTNISNIKYVTSDFLLKSIIKFEIQDIEKYTL
jgi:ubiquinone/menaquinone biosynthesis C-methylase UbiE